MAKKSNNYFNMFSDIANDAIFAAHHLEKTVKNYNPEKIEKLNKTMHEIEHGADLKKHQMMKMLVAEFITPIEREDIATLSYMLDDVLDSIEEVYQMFFMYNVKVIRPEAIDFVDLIVRATEAMKACFDEFEHFHKSDLIAKKIVEVNVIEELADALYFKTVRELYTKEKDPMHIMVWVRLFDRFERICDECEHVADTIGSVIMKNS
jgi:predicted phosphate transport protein (TIGR00153 family)